MNSDKTEQTGQAEQNETQFHEGYVINTVYDDHSGKITSTLMFHNPAGNSATSKANMIAHQVMQTKEKDIQRALRKLGWASPDEVRALNSKYHEEIESLKRSS
jgi:C4-type Zn-finger protein